MKVYLFVCAAFLSLLGCSCTPKNNSHLSAKQQTIQKFRTALDSEFDGYLSNFNRSNLPMKINKDNFNPGSLKEFDRRNSNFIDEYSLALAQIPTSGEYIATITLKKLDSYVPVLTTYDLSGQIIDSQLLSLDYVTYQNPNTDGEIISIDSNLEICITDTIIRSETEDIALRNSICDTIRECVIQRKGQILNNGTIEFQKEVCLNDKNKSN